MTARVMVILVVGLTKRCLGSGAPVLTALAGSHPVRTLVPVFPAVTCSVQASMLTGLPVSGHGIVGNGWYSRELAEVQFWRQSAGLVSGERVWETARRRDPAVTCAKMFWWYNMYSSADYAVTPRPIYAADGRKIPDCHTRPASLREELQGELGRFPLFQFWGPGASVVSTRWIVDATLRVRERFDPTLTLVYLPHLDYAFQKFGPDAPESKSAVAEVDREVGRLLEHNRARGVRTLVVSEYGIEPVSRPIFLNRVLREAGLLEVREEQGGEVLDAGASRAFAVADHQSAQVYVREPGNVGRVRGLLEKTPGVERVIRPEHARSGELVVVAEAGAWFAYPYWLEDARAPDFARTVDIHRKPGYDPCELFIDPAIRAPKGVLAWKLLRKKLGFRTLMDVIPLDAGLVRGSHGRVDMAQDRRPLMLADFDLPGPDEVACTEVRGAILHGLFDGT